MLRHIDAIHLIFRSLLIKSSAYILLLITFSRLYLLFIQIQSLGATQALQEALKARKVRWSIRFLMLCFLFACIRV